MPRTTGRGDLLGQGKCNRDWYRSNPVGPVEMYESAESVISPLMVIPRTTQKIEEYIRREEATAEYQGTRTQY